MGWIKGKCGGSDTYTNTDTHETWYKGKCGGSTTWSNGKETIYKGNCGGSTTWTSNKRGSSSFHTWMDDDEEE